LSEGLGYVRKKVDRPRQLTSTTFRLVLLECGKSTVCDMLLIAGSPFQFTVGPITDVGAHKVRAIGPGLEKGEVFVPSE